MQKQLLKVYGVLFVGVLSISTSAILVKFSHAPSGVIAFYRLLFSVLLLLPFVAWRGGGIEGIKKFTRREWGLSFLSGLFLALHFILWFESLRYTSVASSVVIVTLQPLFAFVGAYFIFKEKVSKKGIVCGMSAIIGSTIISWGDFRISGGAMYGDFLALVACALVTAYLLIGQKVRNKTSLLSYTFIVYTSSTVVLLLYVMIKGEPLVGYQLDEWVYFVLLAVFPTLLGHSLFNWSVKYVSTSTVSMVILLEPVGAVWLAYILLDEKVMTTQLLGGLLIFLGVVFFMLDKKKDTHPVKKGINY
ncbi:DMT family transporter [Priestia koreensis]|uniref:DMT family transporter n=1 Tax=Priestia koreensis TaxID=284581 RepID=UPI002040D38C|nr:DMT family transporter [Priestia koreensis]MCM3004381.1 DMT family transporter [Priestia koreensis]